jgi:kinesin family protein C2/C3
VAGLKEATVTAEGEVHQLMVSGNKNRAVGSHDMNAHSSRSHSILCIRVTGVNLHNGDDMAGKLHLIDLAGK